MLVTNPQNAFSRSILTRNVNEDHSHRKSRMKIQLVNPKLDDNYLCIRIEMTF